MGVVFGPTLKLNVEMQKITLFLKISALPLRKIEKKLKGKGLPHLLLNIDIIQA